MLLPEIYVLLWSLLLIVPGIMKSYAYKFVPFIIRANPEMGANEAIELSMKITKGFRMQLFMLDLSFLGWFLLSVLSAGIGFIFLIPYYYSTLMAIYDEMQCRWQCMEREMLKKEKEEKEKKEKEEKETTKQ